MKGKINIDALAMVLNQGFWQIKRPGPGQSNHCPSSKTPSLGDHGLDSTASLVDNPAQPRSRPPRIQASGFFLNNLI
ncbi:MAG: hypothetical protein SV487_09740 [Thermodesulfobacteriota bacterium]|nr:hypothetical protein [Thermodesulfobacteriota bacterium]